MKMCLNLGLQLIFRFSFFTKLSMSRINPKVSVWTESYNPKKSDTLKEIDLYSVLKQCEIIDPLKEKGKSGSIFPFLSSSMNSSDKYSDGVLFIDLDNCSDFSQTIYDSFDELCKNLPNIIGVNFSHSRNLHFYLYDNIIIDNPSKYGERNILFMCCLSSVIKKVTGIDLRKIEGCLDTHTKSFYQRFFLSNSEFKWNPYCFPSKISKEDEKRLRSEYHKWLKTGSMNPVVFDVPEIDLTGDIVVDSNFYINTKKGVVNGYDSRTVIVACVYYHFNRDLQKSIDYICSKFSNYEPMCRQLKSMVSTGSVNYLYDSTTEKILFPPKKGVILGTDEYLSDKLDIDKELQDNRYLYICSNTGTGKSELVKRYIKEHPDTKILYLQMMKSILHGKTHLIEELTIQNTDNIDREKEYCQVHLTIDKLVNTFKRLNPEDYIVFVDESHLLQDHISFRSNVIQDLCSFISKSKCVIFLSATPKSDIKLFQFKELYFTKIQKQRLTIRQIPISLRGKGNKDSSYFKYLIEDIEKRSENRHITIFTNKKEKEWLEYGLKEKDITRFRSDFHSDEKVKSILRDNKILTKWCLSTSYMSVGVEVKHGSHVVVFDVNEGIDLPHIIQSIGRFRPDVIEELEVLIYYRQGKLPYHPINVNEIKELEVVWNNMIINTEIGDIYNIISTRILGIKGVHPYSKDTLNMLRTLKLSNIIETNEFYTPHSYQILKSLPYETVDVINESNIDISTDGSQKRVTRETELIQYLKSIPDEDISSLGGDDEGYEGVWKSGVLPFKDKVEGRKTIRMCKFIVNMGLPLSKTLDFFNDDLKMSYKLSHWLKDYVWITRGDVVIHDFDGSQKTKEVIEYEQNTVKDIFTKDFLEWCIQDRRIKLFVEKVCSHKFELELCKFLGIDSVEETVQIDIFNDESYKQYKSRTLISNGHSLGGKKSSPKKSIRIEHIETKEVMTFDSKGDCMRFLNMSPRTFSKFIKGHSVRNCKWIISIL